MRVMDLNMDLMDASEARPPETDNPSRVIIY
jgi:hypothetical protein